MEQIIEVAVAHFIIGQSPQTLISRGIGSCVVVCLYEKTKKIGAMVHSMLPHVQDDQLNPLRFVDTALPFVLKKVYAMDVDKKNLEAHLIGGASMFTDFEDYFKLGQQNIAEAKRILEEEGIPITSEEVGGNNGRNLEFFLESGKIMVTSKV